MRLNLLLVLLILISCTDNHVLVSEPKNLVPEDTMVMVIRDLTLIESHIQMKYEGVSVFKELMERSGEHILANYNMSTERFESSINYYGSRQEMMQQIYSRVLDSLNVMSGKIGIEKKQGASDQIIVPDFLKMEK
jgi:hypothetical protein